MLQIPECSAGALVCQSGCKETCHLPALMPRNLDLNCSVICLQLTWKAHKPTSKWSWLNSSVVTRWSQSITLAPYPSCSNALCVRQHTVWATVLLDEDEQNITQESSRWWTPSLNPEDFLSPEPDPKHWWTSIQEEVPGICHGPVCIRVDQSRGGLAICAIWRITDSAVLQDGRRPITHHAVITCFFPLIIYRFTLQYGRWQQCTFKLDVSCPACAHQLRRRRRSPSSSKDVQNRNHMDMDNAGKKTERK